MVLVARSWYLWHLSHVEQPALSLTRQYLERLNLKLER